MKDQIKKLLKVKSLVTLSLTVLFIILALYGTITGEQVLNIFTVIIAFYFGTQVNRKEE